MKIETMHTILLNFFNLPLFVAMSVWEKLADVPFNYHVSNEGHHPVHVDCQRDFVQHLSGESTILPFFLDRVYSS